MVFIQNTVCFANRVNMPLGAKQILTLKLIFDRTAAMEGGSYLIQKIARGIFFFKSGWFSFNVVVFHIAPSVNGPCVMDASPVYVCVIFNPGVM